MPINKDKLQARDEVSSTRPKFVRPESWRYKRLQTNWRKPKGVDNHQRKQKSRGRPGLVKIGYGTPRIAKGLHPSGYTDNLVNNLNDFVKNISKFENIFLTSEIFPSLKVVDGRSYTPIKYFWLK